MKTGLIKTLKNGIEIIRDSDENEYVRYTAVDPNGYIGRTRIATTDNYNQCLACIRDYVKNNNK